MAKKPFKTTDFKELNEMLHKGIVEFQLLKNDDTILNVKGTLKSEHIPTTAIIPTIAIKGRGRRANNYVQVYWDIEKNDFRSFLKESFIGAY